MPTYRDDTTSAPSALAMQISPRIMILRTPRRAEYRKAEKAFPRIYSSARTLNPRKVLQESLRFARGRAEAPI